MAKTGRAPNRGGALVGAWREPFLAALRATGNLTMAYRAASITKATVYEVRRKEPEFEKACQDAIEHAIDMLEAEARRRAYTGWDEPVFQRGEQIGTIRKYSDVLLMFLLRGLRPERYREVPMQVSANASAAVLPPAPPTDRALTDGELRIAGRILAQAGVFGEWPGANGAGDAPAAPDGVDSPQADA